MKRRIILSTLLAVIILAGLAIDVWRLTRPTFSNASQELEYIVTDTVKSNK